MSDKVIRMPITADQRRKNGIGLGGVPCRVTERYLDFSLESDVLDADELITVNVMTANTESGKDRLITKVIVTRKDLLEVLGRVKPKS